MRQTVECLRYEACMMLQLSFLHIPVALPPSKTRWTVAWLTCAHYERLNQCSAEGPKKKGLTMTGQKAALQRVYWISLHIMAWTVQPLRCTVSLVQVDVKMINIKLDVKFALLFSRSPALTSATSKMVLRAALSNRQRFCAKGQSPEQSNMQQPHKKKMDDLDGLGDL